MAGRGKKKELPPEVAGPLEALGDLLRGDDPPADKVARLSGLVTQIAEAITDEARSRSEETRQLDFAHVVAARLREHRLAAGWSQAKVAEAMADAGFPWRQVTVAEVEGAGRRVAFEELLILAALYAVPVLTLILPKPGEAIVLPNRPAVPAEEVTAMFLGDQGGLGRGGLEWSAPFTIVRPQLFEEDARPAAAYWAKQAEVTP